MNVYIFLILKLTMNIEYTCIKKANGVYKNTTPSVEPNETPNDNTTPDTDQPDFDDYPVEIDYPDRDYGGEYFDENRDCYWDTEAVDFGIDSNDFESIVLEVRQDIVEGKFLDKFLHYMDLLKVNRHDFDDFITYDLIEDDFKYQINDSKVFDRLFELYCPDDAFVIPPQTNHHLRGYLDRLDDRGRFIVKNQLNLFGEDK